MGVAAASLPASNTLAKKQAPAAAAQVDRRKFGKIGTEVSILGLGLGSSFFKPYGNNHEEAHKLLEVALAHGINTGIPAAATQTVSR